MGFGDNIRRLREERGMTQEQLASRLGVTRTAVTQWESESTHPRMGSLEAMAALFGVRKSDIVDDVSYGVVPLPTADEMLLLDAFRRLDPAQRRTVLDVARGLAGLAKNQEDSGEVTA